MRKMILGIGLLTLALASAAAQNPAPKDQITDPEKAGPDFLVQGEYEGTVGSDKLGAQVVAKGNGKFVGHFLPGGLPGAGWDGKAKVKLEAKTDSDKTAVTGTWTGAIEKGKLTGKTADGKDFSLTRVLRKSPTLGAKPPEGAIVLFDGSSADKWAGGKVVEENLLQMGTSSKGKFGDHKLHIEFRCPYQPFAGGQGRGNSGVYINNHEVQVLDSFGLESKKDDCAALYGHKAPSLNMCFPPLSWQTYDIEYKLARKGGDKPSGPRYTVYHNGVKVQDDVEIKAGEDKPGGINLQNHGNPVYFKNIWLVETR